MINKTMDLIDWLSHYPRWVLALESVFIVAGILLLVLFAPPKVRDASSTSSEQRAQPAIPKSIHDVWNDFRTKNCTVVVGTFDDNDSRLFDASALIGVGDALALSEVINSLNRIGIANCRPSSRFPGDGLRGNLV